MSKIIHLERVESTNEYAKKLPPDAPDRTIIVADTQSEGKGRLNREWVSPVGGLWMTILVRTGHPGSFDSILTLATGIAVVRTLKDVGLAASLKWPNDIMVGRRKLGGILCEWTPETHSIVIGIGLNLNFDLDVLPEELRASATSTRHELRRDLSRDEIITRLSAEFETIYRRFEDGQTEEILLEWKHHSAMIGQEVQVEVIGTKHEGTAVNIDKDGSLVLRDRTGSEKKIVAGDVTIKPPDQQ